MLKTLLISAILLTIASSTVSACCLLGVQGRPHDKGDAVRAYNWRHGLGYRLHTHRRYAQHAYVAHRHVAH